MAKATISGDRLSVATEIDIRTAAPTFEWSLMFGDALHNLRSALDSLAWALCRLDGRDPAQANRVMFPIEPTPKSWKGRAGDLGKIPAEVLERIREVQPFTLPPEKVSMSVLPVLNRLNNDDKHRELVTLDVHARAIQLPRTALDRVGAPSTIEYPSGGVIAAVAGAPGPHLRWDEPIPPDVTFPALWVQPRMVVQASGSSWELTSLLGTLIDSTTG